jgi:hypothetical protein
VLDNYFNFIEDKTEWAGTAAISATVAEPSRPAVDTERDANRKPGPEALTMTEVAYRISRANERTVRYVAVSPIQRRQALIAHGIPPEFADALDKQVEERLKGGLESQVDLSTHQLFNLRPTTFLEFAKRNAEAFGGAAAAA